MRKLKQGLAVLVGIVMTSACSGQAASPGITVGETESRSTQVTEEAVKIRIIAKGRAFTAVLEDNAASRDFAALLPIELTLKDYHGTEKIADLPSRLSAKGAPDGIDPTTGDLTYYAPWGNLALFYRDFGYSRGLVRLGRIEGDMEDLAGSDAVPVRIERLVVVAH